MNRYVVAVRRQRRREANVADLERTLRACADVRVLAVSGGRAQIEATDAAVRELGARLGDAYIIEELIGRTSG